jgi:hypothetical protein
MIPISFLLNNDDARVPTNSPVFPASASISLTSLSTSSLSPLPITRRPRGKLSTFPQALSALLKRREPMDVIVATADGLLVSRRNDGFEDRLLAAGIRLQSNQKIDLPISKNSDSIA